MKKLMLLAAMSLVACAHRRPENVCANYHKRNTPGWFQCVQLEKIHRQQQFDRIIRDHNRRMDNIMDNYSN